MEDYSRVPLLLVSATLSRGPLVITYGSLITIRYGGLCTLSLYSRNVLEAISNQDKKCVMRVIMSGGKIISK